MRSAAIRPAVSPPHRDTRFSSHPADPLACFNFREPIPAFRLLLAATQSIAPDQSYGGTGAAPLYRLPISRKNMNGTMLRSFAGVMSLLLLFRAAPASSRAAQIAIGPSADTALHKSAPDNNMGANGFVSAGATGEPSAVRALFRFDLASVIPQGSKVLGVRLRLTVTGIPSFNPLPSTFEVRRVNQSWGEGAGAGNLGAPAANDEATWNARFFPSLLWSSPGCAAPDDFVAVASSTVSVDGAGDYTFPSTSTLVADVQTWLDSAEANHGWILMSQSENLPRTARRFGSRESASPPSLMIDFLASPAIDSITLVDGSIQLQFTAEADYAYDLQFKESLGNPDWHTLQSYDAQPVAGTVVASDPAANSVRFYRLSRTGPGP